MSHEDSSGIIDQSSGWIHVSSQTRRTAIKVPGSRSFETVMAVTTRPETLSRRWWVLGDKTEVTEEGHVRLLTSTACAIAVCLSLTVQADANPRLNLGPPAFDGGSDPAAGIITVGDTSAARRAREQARRKALDARRAGRRAERARRNAKRSGSGARSPFRNPRPQLNEVLRANRGTPTAAGRASREAARAQRKARDADRRAKRETRRAREAERRRQRTRDLRDQQFRR